ncbi:hypothetical protein AB6A40_001806 [Gnathostoma spinigerum]|uniref:BTB domain-containing protein n=1 Tax=Gnathostoma spinigerum TaxID=75299 RepID=A0ABD6EF04_9BILA
MGSVGSSLLKSSQSASNLDWIGPSTSQRLPAKRHRFASLFAYRYVSDSLLRFNSRRKNRPISRETQRAFKDLISSWSCSELAALCTEMESSWALRELVILAESARPPVLSISDYLSKALDDRIACDAFIVFKNKRYDVHSSILLARCQYFSEQYALLSKPNGPGPFEISLPELEISNELFEAFLRYIYTGKIINVPKHEQGILNEILSRLRCGQSLEENLANFDFERNGDCTLVFTTNDSYSSDKVGRRNDSRDYFVQCSSVMMTARSDFFRSIIKRKQQNDEPLTIVIDEHLFPRVYAPVILHAIYTGRLDLSKTMDGCPVSTNSLNEVQAIASGRRQRSPLRQAIDVYQISRFLNLYFLAQACEDVMVSELSADTLSGLWSWSSEPDGSAYVKRQCIAYLRGEFSRICSSYLLYELDEDLLYECLLSDYVQVSV